MDLEEQLKREFLAGHTQEEIAHKYSLPLSYVAWIVNPNIGFGIQRLDAKDMADLCAWAVRSEGYLYPDQTGEEMMYKFSDRLKEVLKEFSR